MEECFVFVDNGFLKLVKKEFEKQSGKKLKFFKTFRNILQKENLKRNKIFIYDAPPYQSTKPTPFENKLKQNYDTFTMMAKSKKWISFREGSCVKIKLSDGSLRFSQKGVDALMIMDMYECLMDFPNVKKMILFASDSDFVPIVQKMKENGREVILYTYFDRIRNSKFSTSNQLLKSASRWNQLRVQDFE